MTSFFSAQKGSCDLKTWTHLRDHEEDKSLNSAWACTYWPLPKITESFRYLKVLQKGHNKSGYNFLVLSSIEFFGDLTEMI